METAKTMKLLGAVAIVFGAMTVFSGGRALFGGADARAAVGNAVDFVLWFNFLAGFFYVLTGAGIMKARSWAGAPHWDWPWQLEASQMRLVCMP